MHQPARVQAAACGARKGPYIQQQHHCRCSFDIPLHYATSSLPLHELPPGGDGSLFVCAVQAPLFNLHADESAPKLSLCLVHS